MALTGIELSAGIVVGSNKPIDAKFGPYATTTAALADIGATLRYKGLTVGIEENGKVVEYWFSNGILNTDLVVKISPASSQLTGVESNVATLTTGLATEVTRATAAEATLTTDLASEVTRATAAESTLTTNLAAEVTRATAAEGVLADDIAAVDLRIDNVLENLDPVKIDSFTEVLTKLSTDKGELSDAIVALGTSANSALGDEITRATAAEATLTTNLAAEVTRATAAETQLGTDLATEVTRATAAETQLDTDLTAEVTRATAAEATLTTNLASEVTRATAAETQLTTDLATETTTRTSEITRVDGLITAQDTRLTAAETSISGLGTMSTQDSDDVNITGGTISGVNLSAQTLDVGVGTTADLFVGNDGKVGIGTEAPTEKLTVNGNISLLNGGLIKTLGTPVDATDAATKGYVDTAVSGVQASLDAEILRATAAEDDLEASKQLKLTISDTAPDHAEGREWIDTIDFRRYISFSGIWIEGVVV
jgi:hypothetical protein